MANACVCAHSKGEHRGGKRDCRLCACESYCRHRPPEADDLGRLALIGEARMHTKARIFDALASAGKLGHTFEEVERRTGLNTNTVRGRLSELAAEGVVRESWRRRVVSTGRKAVVYVLTDHYEAPPPPPRPRRSPAYRLETLPDGRAVAVPVEGA